MKLKKGSIVYDVKCSNELPKLILEHGGKPVMEKTGHFNIKNRIRETSAILGGEMSGHIFINHNWYGFGRVNAAAAVTAAKSYTANSLGTLVNVSVDTTISGSPNIPDNSSGTVAASITKPAGSNGIVEYVEVKVAFSHPSPKTMGLRLQSPGGTWVNLMQPNLNMVLLS